MNRKAKIALAQSRSTTRDDLIEYVRRGEMTTVNAERRATELGLTPLISSPNQNDFDPIAEPFWSIPMALAWIMTRDANSVREMWDRWRAEKEFWSWSRWQVPGGPIYEGYLIKVDGPVGLISLSVASAFWQTEGRVFISRNGATAELLKALQAGTIGATGIPTEGAHRTPISAYHWRDLDLYEEKHRIVVRTNRGLGTGYDDLAFDSKIMQTQWRAVNTKIIATVRGEAEAIAALATMLKKDKNLRRENAWRYCQSAHGVSRRGFQSRVWPQARVKADLSNLAPPGRKQKSSR
jgi:hypothetical protein